MSNLSAQLAEAVAWRGGEGYRAHKRRVKPLPDADLLAWLEGWLLDQGQEMYMAVLRGGDVTTHTVTWLPAHGADGGECADTEQTARIKAALEAEGRVPE